jgi:hypothetical protein
MECREGFTTDGKWRGIYNGWNLGRDLQRKECREGFTTDGIWGGIYNGWNIGRD